MIVKDSSSNSLPTIAFKSIPRKDFIFSFHMFWSLSSTCFILCYLMLVLMVLLLLLCNVEMSDRPNKERVDVSKPLADKLFLKNLLWLNDSQCILKTHFFEEHKQKGNSAPIMRYNLQIFFRATKVGGILQTVFILLYCLCHKYY